MRIWRLTLARHRHHALKGSGARHHGGRWNSIGTAIAYTTCSLELAVLEGLVHLDLDCAPEDFYWLEFDLPDDAVGSIEPLPRGWDAVASYPANVQSVGDEWIKSARSLAVRVPSVVLPERANVLVNPRHPRFAEIREVDAAPFLWPRRLTHYLGALRGPRPSER